MSPSYYLFTMVILVYGKFLYTSSWRSFHHNISLKNSLKQSLKGWNIFYFFYLLHYLKFLVSTQGFFFFLRSEICFWLWLKHLCIFLSLIILNVNNCILYRIERNQMIIWFNFTMEYVFYIHNFNYLFVSVNNYHTSESNI